MLPHAPENPQPARLRFTRVPPSSGARYALRPDGFAKVAVSYKGGELITKTLTFSGSALYLNYATSAAGSIKVKLLDGNGVVIPGYEAENSFEIIDNQITRAVQ